MSWLRTLANQWLLPSETVTEADVERGLRAGHWESVYSIIMLSLVGNVFLSAWALRVGASMTYVGLLNGAGMAAIVVQLPAIWLTARWPQRKLFWALTQVAGRLSWLILAALPLVVSAPERVRALTLGLVYVAYLFINLGGPAWMAWLRDFIPEERMGHHLGTRNAAGLVAGSAAGILAGLLVDKAGTHVGPGIYNLLFGIGGIAGCAALVFGLRQPEPRVEVDRGSFLSMVLEPMRDGNFRRYIHFMVAWGVASMLALPFTTAYMIERLQMDMSWAVGLVMLGQTVMACFMPIWGRLSDRLTSKSVLAVCCPLYLMLYPVWILAGNIPSQTARQGMVILLHILFGLANGGLVIATTKLLLKCAPRGGAAAYGGLNATTVGVSAVISPWVGGQLADRLETAEFSIQAGDWLHLRLAGLDYVFLAALFAGLYGWKRARAIRETGEVKEMVILGEMAGEIWGVVRAGGRHAKRGLSGVASWVGKR